MFVNENENENYTEMTLHQQSVQENVARLGGGNTGPTQAAPVARKPRVHWTALEWEQVSIEYLRREDAGVFETGRQYDLAGKIRLCQQVLPADRRCNNSRFYHPNFKREVEFHIRSAKDRLASRKDLEAHKARGERNSVQIVADIETRIVGIEDMLDELAKLVMRTSAEQAELRTLQAGIARTLAVLVGDTAPDETPPDGGTSPRQAEMHAVETGGDGAPAGPRVDVVGLLDTQAARLARHLQEQGVAVQLRNIRSDDFHQVAKFAHDVVLCTDFSPKNAQSRLRDAGCRILFVSGNVTNIVRAMKSRFGNAR